MTSTAINFEVARDFGMRENAMPNGEKFSIFKVANTSLYAIAHAASAKPTLVEELTGMYTSPARAQESLNKYLTRIWEQVKKEPAPSEPLPNVELQKRSEKEFKSKQ